jgi:hypothetical protein
MQALVNEAEALESGKDPDNEVYQKIIADLLAGECTWFGKRPGVK